MNLLMATMTLVDLLMGYATREKKDAFVAVVDSSNNLISKNFV